MTWPRMGVEPFYRDAFGKRQDIADEVQGRLRALMGTELEPGSRALEPVAVVRPGARLPRPGEVTLEDGTSLGRLAQLPPDVPFGYHRLAVDAGEQLLICGPGRCALPDGMRSWGWSVQLYSVRSATSWGIGDLADLREMAAWSAAQGAGFVVVNPLSAAAPALPVQPSPYFPSSRRFRNPLYLRIESVPGAEALGSELASLAAAGRALNERERIDRDAAFALKMDALQRIWRTRPPLDGLDAYRAQIGPGLRQWATYAVLVERHGSGWSRWPEELRRPDSTAVAHVAAAEADRVAFHEWIQWQLDEQLARPSAALPLIHDMPVGVDRDGADAWAWQDSMALGANIGAPPDVFNQAGQDWGLPPLIPHQLRQVGYEPFIQTVRASLRHAGGLRIDHAMGLFRLWWLPLGESPRNGAYVRYPT
ncbi:MAG TPA: 4-alpha-glucanotransferase, partial [Candidatus Limnocylindrales bacterium]|nr:4-alpha-glucanotransferase [Candidatus Limnocylindrales bacterium]